jgi:hypothetical protein
VSFVIDFGERFRRISSGLQALAQSDGTKQERIVPPEYIIALAEGNDESSQGACFELMIEFIHRSLGEGRDSTKFRDAAISIATGGLVV